MAQDALYSQACYLVYSHSISQTHLGHKGLGDLMDLSNGNLSAIRLRQKGQQRKPAQQRLGVRMHGNAFPGPGAYIDRVDVRKVDAVTYTPSNLNFHHHVLVLCDKGVILSISFNVAQFIL